MRLLPIAALLLTASCSMTFNGKKVDAMDALDTIKSLAPEKKASSSSPTKQAATQKGQNGKSAKPELPPFKGTVHAELDPETSPNPLIIEVGPAPTHKTSTGTPWSSCGNYDSYMSSTPVVKLKLKAGTKIHLQSSQAALVNMPNGKFRCWEHKTIGNNRDLYIGTHDYPAGTYEFYAMGRKGYQVPTKLTFTIVDRIPADADKRLEAKETIALSSDEKLNPVHYAVDVEEGPVYSAAHLKLDCSQRDLVPVRNLKLGSSSTYKVYSPQGPVYLRDESGKCIPAGGDLSKGTYAVFVETRSPATSVELAVHDEERALTFAKAPTIKAGKLTKPLPVKVELQAATYRPKARSLCGQIGRAPDFYIDAKKKVQNARLSTLVADSKLNITVAGPLGKTKTKRNFCKSNVSASFKVLKGKYAVWVDGGEEMAGKPAYLALKASFDHKVKDQKAEGDPLQKLGKVPSNPSLAERSIWWHYPYYDRKTEAVEPLFLDVPSQLFVFLTKDADEFQAGEPLLLLAHGEEKSQVLRANGQRREVRTERLTTQKPGKVAVPDSWPEIVKPDNAKEAWRVMMPTDRVTYATWEEKDAELYSCVGNWMRKNDPTWGKDYDLVNLRTGETMTDRKFRKADRVCGAKKVLKAEKKMVKKIYKNRVKARKSLEKKLAKRVGKS